MVMWSHLKGLLLWLVSSGILCAELKELCVCVLGNSISWMHDPLSMATVVS